MTAAEVPEASYLYMDDGSKSFRTYKKNAMCTGAVPNRRGRFCSVSLLSTRTVDVSQTPAKIKKKTLRS